MDRAEKLVEAGYSGRAVYVMIAKNQDPFTCQMAGECGLRPGPYPSSARGHADPQRGSEKPPGFLKTVDLPDRQDTAEGPSVYGELFGSRQTETHPLALCSISFQGSQYGLKTLSVMAVGYENYQVFRPLQTREFRELLQQLKGPVACTLPFFRWHSESRRSSGPVRSQSTFFRS